MSICPYCSSINPDGALRCDCGYDFRTKTRERLPPKPPPPPDLRPRVEIPAAARVLTNCGGIVAGMAFGGGPLMGILDTLVMGLEIFAVIPVGFVLALLVVLVVWYAYLRRRAAADVFLPLMLTLRFVLIASASAPLGFALRVATSGWP
jgi:hypothetical protein